MSQPKIEQASDSLIAQIAGDLLSGYVEVDPQRRKDAVQRAVAMARALVAEVERTRPVGEETP